MADPIEILDESLEGDAGEDVDMQATTDAGNNDDDNGTQLIDTSAVRTPFVDYLKSPIVELAVGKGSSLTILTAHQDLLIQSPYFAQACAAAPTSSSTHLRLELPDEDLEAVGSLVEYLYRGDYFPREVDGQIEDHPSLPDIDIDGTYLLKHARVYTLAGKLGLPSLEAIAHKKIHETTSTARGEIAYARYVYATTSRQDATIRRPVAAFWGTRSHLLRHEAEDEFKAMCLEFPQFGFDVLTMVLDQKEKRAGGSSGAIRDGIAGPGGSGISVGVETPTASARGRKRMRNM